MLMSAWQLNRNLMRGDVLNREVSRAAYRRQVREKAGHRLYSVLSPSQDIAADGLSALSAALERIGKYEGITFAQLSPHQNDASVPSVNNILRLSGVRGRQVRITPEDRWWRGDSGALLGFKREDSQPVALLPSATGGYRMLDPALPGNVRVDAERARRLLPEAWSFYRPLPDKEPVSIREMLRQTRKNLTGDFLRFLISGTFAGLLTVVPAVLIGVLVDRVLPTGSGAVLTQFAIGLAAFAVAAFLMNLLQGASMMRLEGRTASRLTAATWDRLLKLRTEFFKNFTAGDLAARTSVFLTLRDAISGMVGGAIISIVFLVPAILAIFLYDTSLGWLSLAVGLLSIGMALAVGLKQIEPQRRHYEAARQNSGNLFSS